MGFQRFPYFHEDSRGRWLICAHKTSPGRRRCVLARPFIKRLEQGSRSGCGKTGPQQEQERRWCRRFPEQDAFKQQCQFQTVSDDPCRSRPESSVRKGKAHVGQRSAADPERGSASSCHNCDARFFRHTTKIRPFQEVENCDGGRVCQYESILLPLNEHQECHNYG